jgi:hypothetical protein
VRILLDESLPRQLVSEIPEHQVRTVRQEGWAGVKNGELLRIAATAGFEIFVTPDQNLQYQQNVRAVGLAIVVLVARSNRLDDLRPLIPELLAALSILQPGSIFRIGA